MSQTEPVSAKSVPALARTDVRPAEPVAPMSERRRAGRAIVVVVAVLVTVALLVFGLVFALRHELIDPALLSADLINGMR
jgi:hypothetical protein